MAERRGSGDVPALRARGVGRVFATAAGPVEVLRSVDLVGERGESVAVVGPSGTGKSTLLYIVGALDPPTAGTVEIGGRDPYGLSEPELARFRNETVGFVFQEHHLLPQYSVLENVLLPAWAFPRDRSAAEARARELLAGVGLGHRLDHRPAQLSGGERQRAAVARALVNRPVLLLCDEPTGSLDEATAETVADLLFDLHRREATLLVVVTHSPALAARCGRRLELRDGTVHEAAAAAAAVP